MSHRFLFVLCLHAAVLQSCGHAVADTVHLKGGDKIEDCRILDETPARLNLRTPQGKMQVPRSAVLRVDKKPCTFDIYDKKYVSLDDTSTSARDALWKWCLKRGGLRKEIRILAKEIMDINPEHVDARHALGYVRSGSEWVKLPKLSVTLTFPKDTELANSIRSKFALAVADRGDLQIRKTIEKDTVHTCTFVAKVSTAAGGEVRFYGMKLSKDSVAVSVVLRGQGKLFKSNPRSVRITGQATTAPGAADRAVSAAFMSNTKKIHSLLDGVLAYRTRAIEAALINKKK